MKRIVWIFVLLALACGLAGCAETAQPMTEAPETVEMPEAVEMEEAPETPEEAEPEAPVETAEPEQPVEPEPEIASEPEILWDAQPVYVYNGDGRAVAVDPAGQAVLELEDGELSLLRDSFTGEIRGVVARMGTGESRVYDCQGRLIAGDCAGFSFGCTDRVFWYSGRDLTGCTIRSLQSGDVQWEDLKSVSVLGSYLYAGQTYWNDPALLLNQDGTLARELERGFSLAAVVHDGAQDYAIVEARDGTQILLDQEGNACLHSFYDRVTGVSEGCALVKAGDEYGAIDLETGKTVFRSQEPLAGLLPEGAVLEMEGTGGQLVDRQGNLLYPGPLEQLQVWEEDGEPVFLLGVETDRNGTTWVVFLELDGTERLRVEVGLGGLTMLLSRRAVYATNRDTRDGLNRIYETLDLTTGETAQLPRTYCGVSGSELDGETYLTAYYRDGDRVLYDVLSWEGQPLFTGLEDCTDLGCGVLQCRQGEKQGLLCLDGTWLFQVSADADD